MRGEVYPEQEDSMNENFKAIPTLNPEDWMLFWGKVDRTEGCWLWTAATSTEGYGVFHVRVDGKISAFRAPRIALSITHSFPAESVVCHKCDNPRCVNPAHLFAADQKTNIQDAIRKGRFDPYGLKRRRRSDIGAKHHKAKLKDEDVLAIRASSEAAKVLAPQYGVCQATIHHIRNRRIWTHLA
jgi:hypothetical protein